MLLSALAIKRPITTIMIISIGVLLGLISFTRIGVDLLPDIAFPAVVVITDYQAAGPQEVETLVSKPLEEAVGIVSGVRNLYSQSLEGRSLVMAEFNWGVNMDMAALEVREKIDMVRGFLPEEAADPIIIKADPTLFPIMQINLSGTADRLELTAFAENVIRPRLERLSGVSSVSLMGDASREIQVYADPMRLQAHGLSLTHLVSNLRAENLNLPGGTLEEGDQRLTIRTVGEFSSLEELEETRIMSPAGIPVRLGDVARVQDGLAEQRQISRLNGQESLGLSVQKQSGHNTVLVARRINNTLNDLLGELPPGVDMVVSMNQARFIEISVMNVMRNMVIGGILAIILLFVFLRSWKTTLIISLAIPTSIIITFNFFYFMDLTLNLLSLGGLALGIGMLVDNSIVVLESITRHRQLGKERAVAALEGTKEVGTAVTASTITTLAVFAPIIYIPGMASEIFGELALTVAFALIASLLISLTFIPMAASRMDLEAVNVNPLVKRVGSYLEVLKDRYRRALAWSLNNRRKVLVGAAIALILSVSALPLLGMEFLGRFDWGEITIDVEMPPGVLLQDTDRVVGTLEEYALNMPDVESVHLYAGRMAGFRTTATDSGTIGIRLKKDRTISTQEAVEELREVAAAIPGARISVESAGGIIAGVEFFGEPVTIYIQGPDLKVLEEVAGEVRAAIERVPGIRDVRSGSAAGSPEIQVVVDRAKMGLWGLRAGQVAQEVKAAMEGITATRYRQEGQEIDVRVALESGTIQDLEALNVLSPLGLQVRLEDVADFRWGTGPTVITRNGQERITEVTAKVVGRDLGTVNRDVRAELEQVYIPTGYTLEFGGETQEMRGAFRDLTYALLFASILVYMVLASQFESLLQPLIIMVSFPLALVGVVLALGLGRFPLSIPVMIGLITLAGIVVNNAIVFLDYLNQLRRQGMPVREAIMEAGSVRLRPILMTTLTTVLGMAPLALGIGEGTELQQPMALAIIGGLVLSTVLTLLILPVAYTVAQDYAGRWMR